MISPNKSSEITYVIGDKSLWGKGVASQAISKMISIAKKVEKLVGHKLPGQVMRAGHRLLSYSMDEVPTAVGA